MLPEYESIKKLKVFQEGGRACYFYINQIFCSRAFIKHPLWETNLPIVSYGKNNKVNWYYLAADLGAFDYSLKRVLEDESYLDKCEERLSLIVREAKEKLSDQDYSKLTIETLFSLLDEYIKFYGEIGMSPIVFRQLDRALTARLRVIYKDRADIDEILALVSFPTKRTYSRQEDVAILELAIKASQKEIDEKEITDALEKIWQKFYTSSLGYFDEKPKTIQSYEDRFSEEIKNDPSLKLAAILKEEKDHAEKRYVLKETLDEEDKKILDIAGLIVYIKDHYKFKVNQLQFLGEPIFLEISKRTNHELGLIKNLFPSEMKSLLLDQKIDYDAINKRTENYFIYQSPSGVNMVTGSDAEKVEKEIFSIDHNQKVFKGRSASRGYGKGTARVILSPADFIKMTDGDILVVMNTSPDFVPIMKMAQAIVAEEGGITGHVSVVSREFGIPAVVGISSVTRIIKDGDVIEVDANTGTVRKVEK